MLHKNMVLEVIFPQVSFITSVAGEWSELLVVHDCEAEITVSCSQGGPPGQPRLHEAVELKVSDVTTTK